MSGTAAYFRARETAREDEIDGQPLAPFSRRAAGFVIDSALISLLRKPVEALWARHAQYEWERHTLINIPHLLDVMVLILYFALVLYVGNGRTIGKRLMRIQVISLTHERITFLQALERALGSVRPLSKGVLALRSFSCSETGSAPTIDLRRRSSLIRVSQRCAAWTSRWSSPSELRRDPPKPGRFGKLQEGNLKRSQGRMRNRHNPIRGLLDQCQPQMKHSPGS